MPFSKSQDDPKKAIRDPKVDLKIEHYATWLSELVIFIQQRRDEFIERVKERRKQRFRWWKRIIWITALLRIFCCLGIMVMAIHFRYHSIGYLLNKTWIPAGSQSLVAFLFYGGIAATIALCCFIIVFDFILCLVAQLQHPHHMSIFFVVTQLFTYLLICLGCFSGGAAMNSDKLSAFLYGDSLYSQSYPLLKSSMEKHQSKHECCGAYGPEDWLHFNFYTYSDLATYHKMHVLNNMQWMEICSKHFSTEKEAIYCATHPTCCTGNNDCIGQAKRKDYLDMVAAGDDGDQRKTLQLASQFVMDRSRMYTRGCYPVLTEKLNKALLVIGIFIFLLCLISIIMALLITAAILYHSSVGEVDFKNFIVAPATGTALVRFFMWLDGMIESTDTITDFSIIEEMKQFDVDEGFGDNDLVHDEQENSA